MIGLLGSKLAAYAVAIVGAMAAVLGFAVFERRSGAASVRAQEARRELDDRRTADAISADVAREPDPKAALDKEFSR